MKTGIETACEYSEPGKITISDDPEVAARAESITRGMTSDAERARALFYWVRDMITYNPYSPFSLPEDYRPLTIMKRGAGYCVQKSTLLAAMVRSQGIPARLVFADIINHRLSDKLREQMGSNIFSYHGYVEMFINGGWISAAPIFEKVLCDKLDIFPVEFDGHSNALLHRLDKQGRVNIEYIKYHGVYDDIPLDEIMKAWEKVYCMEKLEAMAKDSLF
ncbi:MAG: transglutaminase-like domain-containing protein [Thermodesulfobacteriota bacterium]|nr:transglutaminase-like domain-containing protein [Thermodesulfobacteriota bacterium]